MNKKEYEFNINNPIKFRLGARGRRVYKEYYQQFKNLYSDEEIEELIKPDEDGFYKMQMHRMISIFGNNFTLGSECVIENCILLFEEKDFELVSL